MKPIKIPIIMKLVASSTDEKFQDDLQKTFGYLTSLIETNGRIEISVIVDSDVPNPKDTDRNMMYG